MLPQNSLPKKQDTGTRQQQGISKLMSKVYSSRKNLHQRCKTMNEVNLKQEAMVVDLTADEAARRQDKH